MVILGNHPVLLPGHFQARNAKFDIKLKTIDSNNCPNYFGTNNKCINLKMNLTTSIKLTSIDLFSSPLVYSLPH